MMANGRWVLELTRRNWVDLDEEERQVFEDWLKNAQPHDLYMLIKHTRREAKRRRLSSVKEFKAVTPEEKDDE